MGYGLLILLGAALVLLIVLGSAVLARSLTVPPRRTAGRAAALGLPLDPAEAGVPYETRTLHDADGEAVETWVVDGLDRSGLTIVMLHGWGDSRLGELLWLDVLRPVAAKLVLFDQRGHGESPHRRSTWGEWERDDVLAILAEWKADAGDRPVVLMGYSMGAAVAVDAAGSAGESVAAVVADSPYRRPNDVVRRTMRRQRLPTWPLVELAFGWLGLTLKRLRRRDVAEDAARMTQPLLVLHGVEDFVAPLKDAKSIADAAPRGELCVFQGADHLQAAGLDPAGYVQILREFFTEIGALPRK